MTIGAFALLAAVATSTSTATRVPLPMKPLPSVSSRLRTELRHSAAPVWLPEALPANAGTIASIVVLNAGADGYTVAFSPVANCSGSLACAPIHIAGYAQNRTRRGDRTRLVRMFDGRLADYEPENCTGSGCTEASLTFERGGAVYEIDAKLARDDLPVLRSIYAALRRVH